MILFILFFLFNFDSSLLPKMMLIGKYKSSSFFLSFMNKFTLDSFIFYDLFNFELQMSEKHLQAEKPKIWGNTLFPFHFASLDKPKIHQHLNLLVYFSYFSKLQLRRGNLIFCWYDKILTNSAILKHQAPQKKDIWRFKPLSDTFQNPLNVFKLIWVGISINSSSWLSRYF